MSDYFDYEPDFDATVSGKRDYTRQSPEHEQPDIPAPEERPSAVPGPSDAGEETEELQRYRDPELEDELGIEKGWHRRSLKDPEVFDLFCHKYYDRIFKYLFNMMRNRHDAEELTQATFTIAFEQRTNFVFRNVTIGAWYYRIARNLATKELKERKKLPRVPLEHVGAAASLLVPLISRPDHRAISRQERHNLALAMDALDPDCYSWLQLHFVTGLSTPQVAAIAGVRTGTMKSRLSRCVAKLQDRFLALEDEKG